MPQRLRGLLAAAICVCPAKRKPNSETDQQSNVFSSFFLLLVSRRKETQASEGTFRPGTKESRLYKKQQKAKKNNDAKKKKRTRDGEVSDGKEKEWNREQQILKKRKGASLVKEGQKKKMCNEGQGGCVVFERVCDRLESFDWMLGARTRSDVSATVHRNEPGSDKASAREGPFRHFLETILEQRCAGCNYAYVCRPAGIAFFLFLFYPRCGEGGGRGLLLCVLLRLSGLALEEDPQTSCRSASTWKRATDSVVRD